MQKKKCVAKANLNLNLNFKAFPPRVLSEKRNNDGQTTHGPDFRLHRFTLSASASVKFV